MTFKFQEPIVLHTSGFDPFNVQFNAFEDGILACASACNFGIQGAGRAWIFDLKHDRNSFCNFKEGVLDVSWNEKHKELLACALCDGSIALCTYSNSNGLVAHSSGQFHAAEVSSLEWNSLEGGRSSLLLSTSMDGSIALTDVNHFAKSVAKFDAHNGQAYEARWSPRECNIFLSVGADRAIKLWDIRQSAGVPIHKIPNAHHDEILTVDWNKWNNAIFATGSVDRSIAIWDWRLLARPSENFSHQFSGHRNISAHYRAVKKVRWSPWNANNIYSVGYDMALRVWNVHAINPIVGSFEAFSEFATGVEISPHASHDPQVAVCAWDQTIRVLNPIHWGQMLQQDQ